MPRPRLSSCVFPASAGMIHVPYGLIQAHVGVPRIRGDDTAADARYWVL